MQMHPPQYPSALQAPWLSCLALGLLCLACNSTSAGRSLDDDLGEPYVPPPEQEELAIGPYLTELSKSVKVWANLISSGRTRQDRDKVRLLQEELRDETDKRFDDLIEQLEVGPPVNREIAAAVLGFSEREEALAPLLAALDDRNDAVVRNALLSLSQLRDPRTPLTLVIDQLRFNDSPEVRGNAAMTVRILIDEVQVPYDRDYMQRVARGGITDPSPVVRTQCALILASVEDPESIDTLEALLSDDVVLVASAAARSLAYIGTRNSQVAGRCARALSGMLPEAKPTLRGRLLENLKLLRNSVSDGLAFEDEPEKWLEWAHGLP